MLESTDILSGVMMSRVPRKEAKATVDISAGTKVKAENNFLQNFNCHYNYKRILITSDFEIG